MYFLGQAGNLRGWKIWRHTFAVGSKKDREALKTHLSERYKVKKDKIVLYHTGRTALAAALGAVLKDAPKGTEVIVTAMTCFAVVEAVRAAGFTPVFADVEPETLHFNGKTLEDALKKHPEAGAIVVQNNLGYPCKIKEIEKVAKKAGLPIIEDLAHCAGISYSDGREAGTVGVAAALSFGKGKSIDTISGGAVILREGLEAPAEPTKLPKLSDRLRDRWYPFFGLLIRGFYHLGLGRYFTSLLLKLHFIKRSADAELNFDRRITSWQAKLALGQLKALPKNRPPLREFYFVENRNQALLELEKAGFIMNDIWYDIPVAPERYFEKSGFSSQECPVAMRLAAEIVNLPTFYPRPALQPARKIIEKFEVKEGA